MFCGPPSPLQTVSWLLSFRRHERLLDLGTDKAYIEKAYSSQKCSGKEPGGGAILELSLELHVCRPMPLALHLKLRHHHQLVQIVMQVLGGAFDRLGGNARDLNVMPLRAIWNRICCRICWNTSSLWSATCICSLRRHRPWHCPEGALPAGSIDRSIQALQCLAN
jgi:hypothetical protein